jgi:hypothetical protein
MPTAKIRTAPVVARVAAGRSVHVAAPGSSPGAEGLQTFGPGEAVTLSPEDVARLGALGFVQLASDQEEAAESAEPPDGATVPSARSAGCPSGGSPSVMVQDGAQVTPG